MKDNAKRLRQNYGITNKRFFPFISNYDKTIKISSFRAVDSFLINRDRKVKCIWNENTLTYFLLSKYTVYEPGQIT